MVIGGTVTMIPKNTESQELSLSLLSSIVDLGYNSLKFCFSFNGMVNVDS